MGSWRTEVFAGLVGAILVIPQGITFAYLAGLQPEYGLYCAIFVTLFCSLLGSSSMMSGPNIAAAILIGTAVLPLAGRGSPVYIDFVFLLCMMASTLIPYALTIAFIGLAQSLVIVRELKMETDQDINLDKEVYAQGLANFLAPFFSSFAGAGSFNRTKANQSLGASTALSGIAAAGFVLILITLLGPVLTYMPMATMAGTLFIVGADMIKWRDIRHYSLVRSELVIYLATFTSIIFFDLAAGVVVAVFLSVSLFLLRISQLDLKVENSTAGTVIKVKGALFYASVAHLTEKFHQHSANSLTVDLQYTTHIDQSAVDFFERESLGMAQRGQQLTLLVNDTQRAFLQSLAINKNIQLISL
jgi:SulP family sulfate permease